MVSVLWKLKVLQGAIAQGVPLVSLLQAGRKPGIPRHGQQTISRYMGAILRLLVSLAGVSLCCLCLAPVARADWGTIYCEASADSIDVASAQAAIAEYQGCINGKTPDFEKCLTCCQNNAFGSHCTTFWTWNSRDFYMCGSLKCDDCMWITQELLKIIASCTQNWNGVDRAAGFVSYNWTPIWWNKYGF